MNHTAHYLFIVAFAFLGTACLGTDTDTDTDADTDADADTDTESLAKPEGEPIASSEEALVTCSGFGCDGLDPGATGCGADGALAQKVDIFDVYFPYSKLGTVALRYSPTCKTFWSHVVPVNSYSTTVADLSRTDGSFTTSGFKTGPSKSPMLYAQCFTGRSVRAGGQIDPFGSSYGSATTAYSCVQ